MIWEKTQPDKVITFLSSARVTDEEKESPAVFAICAGQNNQKVSFNKKSEAVLISCLAFNILSPIGFAFQHVCFCCYGVFYSLIGRQKTPVFFLPFLSQIASFPLASWVYQSVEKDYLRLSVSFY